MMNALDHGRDERLLGGPPLGPIVPNVATLVERCALRYPQTTVFRSLRNGAFGGPAWSELAASIRSIAASLRALGLRAGDRVAIVSQNSLEMLALELAVLSSRAIAVPIFHGYPRHVLTELIGFCGARFLAVGTTGHLQRIDPSLGLERIILLDELSDCTSSDLVRYADLRDASHARAELGDALALDADANDVCLMQYTSGTTGTPKCVQLTHRNILSQAVALEPVWGLEAGGRLLSYLPWHHSFGGIFELFNALTRGATITLEPSLAKDPASILEHWRTVRPTAFFSVPKVYQSLIDLTRNDPDALGDLLHPELRFVFTAAARLPDPIARELESRGIQIVEGWGLTETSPCCTITGATHARTPGVVGRPIAGVSIMIADDGEILVKGPNVMRGYYENPVDNAAAFTDDGWFRTGDVGAIEEGGLRLVGRRDGIFKLSNGEKVVSAEIEHALQSACHYLAFAVVAGSGQDHPVALLLPNRQLLAGASAIEHCACPRSLEELSRCLSVCLAEANAGIVQKFARVPVALLVDGELSIDDGTLTPSMKVVAAKVLETYRDAIEELYATEAPSGGDVTVVPLGAV
jgi:long-subunit acyl-CoA synthetase (AMP-forming)